MIITIGCLLWSVMTLVSAFVNSFVGLLIPRIMLGVFQAACSPPAYSLIADYFSPDWRTTANAIYSLGIYIGGGLSSLSLIMITSIGWRWCFIVVACCGIGSAVVLVIFVREPKRGGLEKKGTFEEKTEVKKESPVVLTLRALAEIMTNPTARYVTIGASFRFIGGFAIGYYHEKYMVGVFPDY
jgi:MFS family permease